MNMLRLPGIGALRERGVPRPLRRARDPRLAGLHVRELRLPDRRCARSATVVEARGERRRSPSRRRPSLAVLCGGSEVEQQAAMLGLDPELGRGELFGELLPSLVAEAGAGVPSTSRRRRAAATCRSGRAAASPTTTASAATAGRSTTSAVRRCGSPPSASRSRTFPDDDPDGRAGVPRDAGAGWDFEDVRDHYLSLLFGVDPSSLGRGRVTSSCRGRRRRADGRGLRRMAARRLAVRRRPRPLAARSVPGAGWGLLDSDGRAEGCAAASRAACSRRSQCG